MSPGSIKALRHRAKALEKQGMFKAALGDIQVCLKMSGLLGQWFGSSRGFSHQQCMLHAAAGDSNRCSNTWCWTDANQHGLRTVHLNPPRFHALPAPPTPRACPCASPLLRPSTRPSQPPTTAARRSAACASWWRAAAPHWPTVARAQRGRPAAAPARAAGAACSGRSVPR